MCSANGGLIIIERSSVLIKSFAAENWLPITNLYRDKACYVWIAYCASDISYLLFIFVVRRFCIDAMNSAYCYSTFNYTYSRSDEI